MKSKIKLIAYHPWNWVLISVGSFTTNAKALWIQIEIETPRGMAKSTGNTSLISYQYVGQSNTVEF